MKKNLFVLALFVAFPVMSGAQQAFQSLGFGIEVGTTGAGVELSFPIVTNHIVIKGGFNAPSVSYPFSSSVDAGSLNSAIDDVNLQLQNIGSDERISTRFSDVMLTARPTVNLSTAKAMLEYYPFKKSSFHFTVGAYFGLSDDFITVNATTDKQFWGDFESLQQEVDALNEKYQDAPGYTPVTIDELRFSAGERTFEIREKDGAGHIDAAISIAKVRPYVGLGFGRSVPNGRVGFQLDLGAWYHGTPSLESSNEVTFDPSAESLVKDISLLDKLSWYPQISFRLTFRIL